MQSPGAGQTQEPLTSNGPRLMSPAPFFRASSHDSHADPGSPWAIPPPASARLGTLWPAGGCGGRQWLQTPGLGLPHSPPT